MDRGPRDEGIIPLSRYRAQLSRARSRKRLDEILDHPDPAQLVPTLSLQDLYYAIREVGLASAEDVLALASPSQVRGFLDLDAWDRDHFVPERAAPWMEALIDLGPDELARKLGGLDPEVLALWVQGQARVYDLEQEAPPEEPEGSYYPTPDTFFLLDVQVGGEAGKRLERFIDWLYRADMDLARRTLMAARWELPSDLEEHAYRWRSGRMADLGYVDYYEALEVYRYLDPASVKAGERTAPAPAEGESLPMELLSQVGEASFLGRTLAQVADAAELERLSGALLHLINRVMSADRVEPADRSAAQAAMARAASLVGLGLELLSHGDPEAAARLLADVALVRIFRVGFSVTLKLQRVARALLESTWVSLLPGEATLLEGPLLAVVTAVRRDRPSYPAAIASGGEGAAAGERPFSSLAEVAHAARLLEEAAALADTVRRGLGVDPRLLAPSALAALRTPPESVTFATLVATLGANVLLDRPAALVPLSLEDLGLLASEAIEAARLRPAARAHLSRALTQRLVEREVPAPEGWPRWLEAWLGHLEQALLVAGHEPAAANVLIRR